MQRPFEITLPETDVSLLGELTHVLGDEGQVFEAPEDWRSFEEAKLIVELVSGGTGALLGTIEVAKLLIKMRDKVRAALQDRPQAGRSRIKVVGDEREIALVDASDADLYTLAEQSQKDGR